MVLIIQGIIVNVRVRFLLLLSFGCGAGVMLLELCAARVLTPYVGSTNVVWTIIIGVLLASMSLGYFLGGRLADKSASRKTLGKIFLGASIFLSFLPLWETTILSWLMPLMSGRALAALGTIVLFSPPSILLSAVSPFLIKMAASGQEHLGRLAGQLSASNSLGSIVGTFLTGFVFLPYLGCQMTLGLLLAATLGLAVWLGAGGVKKSFIGVGILVVIEFFLGVWMFWGGHADLIADVDTVYNRYWIYDLRINHGEKIVRTLKTVGGYQSTVMKNNPEFLVDYLKYFDLFDDFFVSTNILKIN
jgi:MFS family permease